eukprot:2138469-Ditylum_brightwellii.AAC.1
MGCCPTRLLTDFDGGKSLVVIQRQTSKKKELSSRLHHQITKMKMASTNAAGAPSLKCHRNGLYPTFSLYPFGGLL